MIKTNVKIIIKCSNTNTTLGMKAQYSMRQARQTITRAPVNNPPA